MKKRINPVSAILYRDEGIRGHLSVWGIDDASCCSADIAYPQDVNFLNEAREKLEGIIDEACEAQELLKPRTYREKARQAYLKLSKSKKRTVKQLRKAIKAQLQYIRRDVGHIVRLRKQPPAMPVRGELL